MPRPTITEPARQVDVIHETDVPVVGSGTAGLAAALAVARAGADVALVERFGCVGGNMTVVGVEGMAWYRHEQTVEANGLATGRTWPPVASIDSPEAESRLARGEWWFHLTRASLDLDQENQFAEGQVKSDRLLGREFEERSRQRGAAVPESQSLSYEIDSEGFKVVADRLVEEAGVEPMLHRFRDTRKIDAVYNMTENDVREQARFDDSIGIYPEFIDDYGILILPTTGRYFQLPYRNLLPKKVSNPPVAGRSTGGNRVSHAATRNMSCCAVTGQGAGIAAAVSLHSNRGLAHLDITSVHAELESQSVRFR